MKLIAVVLLILVPCVLGADKKKQSCQMNVNCVLPYCHCETEKFPFDLPKNVKPYQLPQLVILTIDDDKLDIKSYQIYKKLFEGFHNSNKCPIRGTLFVSDSENKTSYCLTRNLYEHQHEIAISTVNHTCPSKRCSPLRNFQSWNYVEWLEQVLNMRERLNKYSGIPISDVVGFRAPLLEPASDMHFRIIAGNKFLYDSSLIINSDSDKLIYPFTLDYKITTPLQNIGPIDTYPGLWELPIPTYIDIDQKRERCLKLWEGHCKYDKSASGIAKFLRHHFLRGYYNNRAPVLVHLNADWLKQYEEVTEYQMMPNVGYQDPEKALLKIKRKEYQNLNGVIRFINTTLTHNKDVYFVTAKKAIEWMGMLERLGQGVNITELINNELFDDCTIDPKKREKPYDASCPILRQATPDFDKNDEDFSVDLDDSFGHELEKLLHLGKHGENIVEALQSETLFVNPGVLYFVICLILILGLILIREKYF